MSKGKADKYDYDFNDGFVAPEEVAVSVKNEPLPDSGMGELLLYCVETGKAYHPEYTGGHDDLVRKEFDKAIAAGKTPEQFFIENEPYWYYLVHLENDIWRAPFLRMTNEVLLPPHSVLDWGCGAGGTGFFFAGKGYTVSFANYAKSHGRGFLEWRIAKRNASYPVYDFKDRIPVNDIVCAFDVIEHSSDPYESLERLNEVGKVVALNIPHGIGLPEYDPDLPTLHYKMDVNGLVEYIKSNHKILRIENVEYATYVLYESGA